MAVTKKGTTKKAGTSASPTRAGAGKSATSKAANPDASTPKAKPAANGKAATKKATPVKLTDNQRAMLDKVRSAGEAGYDVTAKPEQRTIDALVEKKLVKKSPKDKATGKVRYLLTKAGQKHAAPAPTTTA